MKVRTVRQVRQGEQTPKVLRGPFRGFPLWLEKLHKGHEVSGLYRGEANELAGQARREGLFVIVDRDGDLWKVIPWPITRPDGRPA